MPSPSQQPSDSQSQSLRLCLSRRTWLRSTVGAGLCASSGLLGWTTLIEPNWLQITGHDLTIPHLPHRWLGKRLIHISDLHAGKVRTNFLLKALRAVNALEPDLLVITGDFVDHSTGLEGELERVLRELAPAKIATVACLGNHDFGRRWSQLNVARQVTEVATDCGIQVLRNQWLELDGLNLVGLDDYWSPSFDPKPLQVGAAVQTVEHQTIEQEVSRRQAMICLCHNPDVCDEDVWSQFEGVILAGHTHGGQCKPPFLPPPILPVRNRKYSAGFFDVGPERQLFISRGLGYTHRVRFNCRPEITVFNMQS